MMIYKPPLAARLVSAFFLLQGCLASAQSFHPYELELANTARDCTYLAKAEQDVYYYLNLARLNGPAFLQAFIYPHITPENLDSVKDYYLVSCIQELRHTRSHQLLHPNRPLTQAAVLHAQDLAATNTFGHASSDGTTYQERIVPFLGAQQISAAEALGSGYNDGLLTVIQLLIDYKVEDLGHRKTLLDPTLNTLGVAILPHPRYQYVSVLEFADNPPLESTALQASNQ